jgi:hypothetical protein
MKYLWMQAHDWPHVEEEESKGRRIVGDGM